MLCKTKEKLVQKKRENGVSMCSKTKKDTFRYWYDLLIKIFKNAWGIYYRTFNAIKDSFSLVSKYGTVNERWLVQGLIDMWNGT